MKTKLKTNGDSGRPLSPASINAIVNQEEEEEEEGSKKELVLTVLTVKELKDAVHRHIYGTRSVSFNFEGIESLDEIIPEIFTYEQQRGGVGALDTAEKERLYEKLMSDLNQAGYDQENIPQHPRQKPTFESTEDLLSCLSDESCSLVRTNGTPQTTSHPTSTMSLAPSLARTCVTSENASNDSIADPPVGMLNDNPNKPHILGRVKHNERIIDVEVGKAAFEDIHLEEVPLDLDQVEHTDLLQLATAQEASKSTSEDNSISSDSESYYSAESNLSNSTTEIFTQKSPNNANVSCDEPNDATTIDATEKTVKAKTPPRPLVTDPELTNEEQELWRKFNCRPLYVRMNHLVDKSKNEAKDLPTPVKRGRGRPPGKGRVANKNNQKNAQSPVGQTFVVECSSSSPVEIITPVIHTSPQSLLTLPQEESYAKVEGTTRKTRIKARKLSPEKLPVAAPSPQEVTLRSCPVPNEDESNRKVQIQMNPNLTTSPSSKKQCLSGEHELFQLTRDSTCNNTAYPQGRNLQAILPTTTVIASAQQSTSVSSESSSTHVHRHSLDEEESLTAAPVSSSPSPPLVMGITSSSFSSIDQETQEALSAPIIDNINSELSIEEELDELLGPIPVFVSDEDRMQISLGESEGEFLEVASLLPELFSDTPSQESFLAEVDVAEVEVGSQNDDEDHHNVVLMESDETHQESPPPEPDNQKPPSSSNKCVKSPKKSPRPGPKSMTRPRESATDQQPSSSNDNMEEPVIKRLKRRVSPSSSSSSDTYLPLVPPSVSQSFNKTKSLSNGPSSRGKSRSPPSAQSALKKGASLKAVPLVEDVDVDENDSSSSSDSSEEDESAPSSEEDVDLFLILAAKPQEKKLLLSMKAECEKESPKFSRLEDLMARTSSYRRRFLEKDNYDIHHGLIMFPPLKDYRFIKSEFNELTPDVAGGRMERLEELLKDQLHNAWFTVKKRPGQKRHGLWERALLHARSDKGQTRNVKRVLGMICLCFHWAENDVPKNLLLVRNRNEPLNWKSISTPRLVMFEDEVEMDQATSMYIYAEGLRHIQVPNIYEGVLTVYAMHYLFSIEYAPSLKPLFKHFDKLTNITG